MEQRKKTFQEPNVTTACCYNNSNVFRIICCLDGNCWKNKIKVAINEKQWMFLAFISRITKHIQQFVRLMIDMVFYKAQWHSNKFTKRLGKQWRCGRGSDDSSRLSRTSCHWRARAKCPNGSYFKKITPSANKNYSN